MNVNHKSKQTMLVSGSRCRICRHVFHGPEGHLGGAILLGDKIGDRIQRYIQKLMAHLGKEHPEQLQLYTQQVGDYLGLLCLMSFDTSDEEVAKERDYLRWQLNKATRRAVVTDERIAEKCKVLVDGCMMEGILEQMEQAPRVTFESRVAALLIEMRNVLEERGRYQDRPIPRLDNTQLPPEIGPAQETT